MTREEKRTIIRNRCLNIKNCGDCPLYPYAKGSCYEDDADIDRNYDILFGEVNPIKPSYYSDSKITPFDVIDDWKLDFYLGNVVKYIKRAGKKDGNSRLQDLKKIRTYVDEAIKREEVLGND